MTSYGSKESKIIYVIKEEVGNENKVKDIIEKLILNNIKNGDYHNDGK